MTQLGRPLAEGRVEYIRLPLSRTEKRILRRRADEERRTMGQMARIIVVDYLGCDGGAPTPSEGDPHDPADRSAADA